MQNRPGIQKSSNTSNQNKSKQIKMKFSTTLIATAAFLASSAMALPTNSTVPNNGMGGTLATASITVENPNAVAQSASTKLTTGIMAITLASAVTAAYAM
ncbi:hypothetical protein FB192DRAFT_1369853, partial [Mucor lusitanicus]